MSDYRIGDEVYIHGIIDEIRKDTIIIKNEGGYFGTISDEIMPSAQPERTEYIPETKAVWTKRDCVDLSERVLATFYDQEYEEWTQQTVTIADVLDSVCDEYTILPSAQPDIIRCKDCKYAEVADTEDSQDGYSCQFHRGSIWFSGSYCSWAERKEE